MFGEVIIKHCVVIEGWGFCSSRLSSPSFYIPPPLSVNPLITSKVDIPPAESSHQASSHENSCLNPLLHIYFCYREKK